MISEIRKPYIYTPPSSQQRRYTAYTQHGSVEIRQGLPHLEPCAKKNVFKEIGKFFVNLFRRTK